MVCNVKEVMLKVFAMDPASWFASPAAEAVTTHVPVAFAVHSNCPLPLIEQLIAPAVVTA